MKRIRDAFQKHKNLFLTKHGQIIFLFLISMLTHGLFIPWMGLYGDDWSLLWLSYKAGSTALFFPANRFLLPYIYSLFSYFLNPVIREWHVLFFVIRFLSVLNLWILLKTLWPEKKQMWVWIPLLFALYPGSLITYQPITFWTVYLQFSFLFASFWLMLAAVNKNNKQWVFISLSAFFAILNLVLSEYLYFLELLRIPILIIYFLNRKLDLKETFRKAVKISIPFLLLFLAFSISRLAFHKSASGYYNVDLGNYFSDPFLTIQYFASKIVVNGIKSGLLAWFKPFFGSELFLYSGLRSILLLSFFTCCTSLIIFLFTTISFENDEEKNISLISIILGVIGLIFAGAPFWIADLPIDIGTANYSRFSIPAAFGSAFLIYGIVTLLLRKRQFSNIFLNVFCGSAVMMHLLSGNFFRNEWELQNRFFWELAWRIPAIDPGTTFFSNELQFWTIGENSISAVINWIYMEESIPIDHIDYYFYYDEGRFINQFPQEKDIPFERSHMAGVFFGNSSQLITFWYQPPACLHIVNEKWDKYNPDIPSHLRKIAENYPNEFIRSIGNSEKNLTENPNFTDENPNNFCFYYQKASLAAENNNWEEVVNLWNTSLGENQRPSYALERLPFIQGLVYTDQYEDSFVLSLEIMDISNSYKKLLCEFWGELSQDNSLDTEMINDFIENKLTCE